jgi:hypothetical protein
LTQFNPREKNTFSPLALAGFQIINQTALSRTFLNTTGCINFMKITPEIVDAFPEPPNNIMKEKTHATPRIENPMPMQQKKSIHATSIVFS